MALCFFMLKRTTKKTPDKARHLLPVLGFETALMRPHYLVIGDWARRRDKLTRKRRNQCKWPHQLQISHHLRKSRLWGIHPHRRHS
jgi:hypothetical protein